MHSFHAQLNSELDFLQLILYALLVAFLVLAADGCWSDCFHVKMSHELSHEMSHKMSLEMFHGLMKYLLKCFKVS